MSTQKIPSAFLFFFLQVNFSSNLDSGSGASSANGPQSHLPLVALSPILHPRIREFRSGLGSARKGLYALFT